MSESLRDCVNTTQDDVSNRSIPKTVGFELMMKSVRKNRSVRITSRLREYYSGRCEQSIDTQDSGVRAHDERCTKSVRITSRLREYYSGRCEQSIDTQDSGVRAHDEKCPKKFEVSESLRDCVNTTQDDVSNRSIPKTVGFELMMKSVRMKIRSVRITSIA